jgi:hypothetical protein
MKKNNIAVTISIFLIKEIWHGKVGRRYNTKNGVICRFYPSCSNYAIMALEKYGFVKGWYVSYKRIRRCNKRYTGSCIDYP